MAQIFTWDRQGFESMYWRYFYKLRGCGASAPKSCRCHDSYVSYSRAFFETNDLFRERAENVIKATGLQQGSTVLVVGCGLGYIMEEFTKLKMIPYGFDNSTYIQGVKNKEKVKVDIPSINILSNQFQNDLQRAFGVTHFDCVITEEVLPSHDSYGQIFSNCESSLKPQTPLSNIVHIVQTLAPTPLVSKTIEEWKSLNPSHTWLNQNGVYA